MEKIMGEEDIKGLEDEIDSAVDRLFVEKRSESTHRPFVKSPVLGSAYEEERFDQEYSSHSPSISLPITKSIEILETELLSLEWEITQENLNKTKEEILALRAVLKGEPDITSVLNLMEKVLSHMIVNEENIRPPLIKFLLDSKDTIKLLMKKETDREINTYKQLAYAGIEARFSCLEGSGSPITKGPPLPLREERETAMPQVAGKEIEAILSRMNLFSERLEEVFKKMDRILSRLGPAGDTRSHPIHVTVFKVGERLFGVGSDKVFKLFKVPNSFHDRHSREEKIRLKDIELRIVDLNKIFSIQGGSRKGETRILTVKDDGEYKGLMVDQVLKNLSTQSEMGGECGEYFSGMIHWKYQERMVDIPILNLKKF